MDIFSQSVYENRLAARNEPGNLPVSPPIRLEQPAVRAKSGYCVSNRIGRLMLVALADMMGQNGLNAVLKLGKLPDYETLLPPDDMVQAFDFADYGALAGAVLDTYGPRGAKVLMVRAGAAFFNAGIGPFMENYGAGMDVGNRLVPFSLKLPLFLKWIARTYNATSDLIVEIKDGGDHYLYVNKRCPICWGRHVSTPDCHHTLGFLQAAIRFIAIDKNIPIRQVSSIAMGDPSCDFEVGKRPVNS